MKNLRALWTLAAVSTWAAACASDPTVVMVTVNVDDTVSALSLLDVTLNQAGAPVTTHFRPVYYDTDAGPASFYFPASLRVPVNGGSTGTTDLIVEGLDWRTGQVIARGTGTAEIVYHKTTQASVTLTAVTPPPDSDGGVPDGDGDGGGGAADGDDGPASSADDAGAPDGDDGAPPGGSDGGDDSDGGA